MPTAPLPAPISHMMLAACNSNSAKANKRTSRFVICWFSVEKALSGRPGATACSGIALKITVTLSGANACCAISATVVRMIFCAGLPRFSQTAVFVVRAKPRASNACAIAWGVFLPSVNMADFECVNTLATTLSMSRPCAVSNWASCQGSFNAANAN